MEQLHLLHWWTEWLIRVLRVWSVSSLVRCHWRGARFCSIDFYFFWRVFFPNFSLSFTPTKSFSFLFSSVEASLPFPSHLQQYFDYSWAHGFRKAISTFGFNGKYIPGCNSQYFPSCMRHQVSHSCFLEKSARKGRKQPRKTKNAIIVAMVTHPQISSSCK